MPNLGASVGLSGPTLRVRPARPLPRLPLLLAAARDRRLHRGRRGDGHAARGSGARARRLAPARSRATSGCRSSRRPALACGAILFATSMGAFGTAFTLASKYEVRADHDLQRVHQLRQLRARRFALDRARPGDLGGAVRGAPVLGADDARGLTSALPTMRPRRRRPRAAAVRGRRSPSACSCSRRCCVSVLAGLVNNYSAGLKSGLTTALARRGVGGLRRHGRRLAR